LGSTELHNGKVAVVGTGNILMLDEGVGVHVIDQLRRKGVPPDVELFDAGVAIADVMDDLSQFDRVIIVDATRGGEEPGAIYKYRLEDLNMEDFRNRHLTSAHEITLVETLMLNKLTDNLPEDILLIGVEPARMEAGIGLSEILEGKMDAIVDVLMEEIAAAKRT